MDGAYLVTGVSYVFIAAITFLALSYSGGCPFRTALILKEMVERARKMLGGLRRVRMMWTLGGGLAVLFVLLCGIEHLMSAFYGEHRHTEHTVIAFAESAVTAFTVLAAGVMIWLFRDAAIDCRNQWRGSPSAYEFWHARSRRTDA